MGETNAGLKGLPRGSDGKESAGNVSDAGSVPGSGRFPGEGNGYPLQYSCLENPMDRGAWLSVSTGSQKHIKRKSINQTTENIHM